MRGEREREVGREILIYIIKVHCHSVFFFFFVVENGVVKTRGCDIGRVPDVGRIHFLFSKSGAS